KISLILLLLVAHCGFALDEEENINVNRNCVNGRCIESINGKCHIVMDRRRSRSTMPSCICRKDECFHCFDGDCRPAVGNECKDEAATQRRIERI
ncbi:hypothetical protein PMAYCL1PPCAC_03333, partial [Pristionchus mayeri]